MELGELDRKIINRLSGDLPPGKTPFATVAGEIGLDETALLEKIGDYAGANIMRRFAAILAHRDVGFAANALVAWQVREDSVVEAAQTMARFDEVTHCYERSSYPEWRYNVYTMIHGTDREQCLKVVEKISALTGIRDYKVLFTVREFKKRSIRYFQ